MHTSLIPPESAFGLIEKQEQFFANTLLLLNIIHMCFTFRVGIWHAYFGCGVLLLVAL